MADYTSFFFGASAAVVPLECVEISHPSFAKTYRFVRNDVNGIIAGGQSYAYQPMSINRSTVSNDLEQSLAITLADMSDDFSKAIKRIYQSTNANVRPKCTFKVFRDDDLSSPMINLQTLEIKAVSKDSKGLATFDAAAPELNGNRTGIVYAVEDFPLLWGA